MMQDVLDFFIVLSVKADVSCFRCKNSVSKIRLRFEIIYLVLEFCFWTHINTFFQIFLDIFEND